MVWGYKYKRGVRAFCGTHWMLLFRSTCGGTGFAIAGDSTKIGGVDGQETVADSAR